MLPTAVVRSPLAIPRHILLAVLLCSLTAFPPPAAAQDTLIATEILGRPTDHSVTLNAVAGFDVDAYVSFGLSPGIASGQTPLTTFLNGSPVEILIDGLQPDTRYYYRLHYRRVGNAEFIVRDEHTFHTRRARGSTFRFSVQSDSHLYDKKGCARLMDVAMRNQLGDSLDFVLDLGDTFGDDHNPFTITSGEVWQLHLDFRPFCGIPCHSAPLFLCLGNHEGENGYYLNQAPPNNLATYATLARQFYYPNPYPDGFYSGNTVVEGYGMGRPENYYAWEWGDALFVVLDVYRHATASARPRGWDWTLGDAQYAWFKQTLESSAARHKFVFAHHVLGQARGGVNVSRFYEWGGYESDGTTLGFAAHRPGWAAPIHQLMAANGVDIFFQGHDHLFAKEELDGVVYQEVPMPSDSTYQIGMLANADAYTSNQLDGSGHLRVTVSPDDVRVDYVRAYLPEDEDATHRNGEVAYSYDVSAPATGVPPDAGSPLRPMLGQNEPNPFHGHTSIAFRLPVRSFVNFTVQDILGRTVATLVDRELEAGAHVARWQPANVASGVYYYRLTASGSTATKLAVYLK